MELSKEQVEFCDEVYNRTNVDLFYSLKNGEVETFEELVSYVEENNLTDEEVIYYSTAIQYLLKNDASLRESIEIAMEYGYELNSIDSELLATLLKSQKNREEWEEMKEETKKVLFPEK